MFTQIQIVSLALGSARTYPFNKPQGYGQINITIVIKTKPNICHNKTSAHFIGYTVGWESGLWRTVVMTRILTSLETWHASISFRGSVYDHASEVLDRDTCHWRRQLSHKLGHHLVCIANRELSWCQLYVTLGQIYFTQNQSLHNLNEWYHSIYTSELKFTPTLNLDVDFQDISLLKWSSLSYYTLKITIDRLCSKICLRYVWWLKSVLYI